MRRPLTLLAALLVGAAFSHAELETSSPEAGATVTSPPTEVTLTFSEPLEVRFSTFKVYPLNAEVDPSAEDAQARLEGLAGALVSEVLEAQGDEDDRADTGVATTGIATPGRSSAGVVLPLKEGLAPGPYVVMWRALSADSHVVQGFFTFTYASR